MKDNLKNWCWSTLADVCQITMGTSPPGESYNLEGEGTPLINGPVEFGRGPLDRTVLKQHTISPLKTCKEGDLLICVRGSTTGRTNIAGFDAAIGRGVAAIRPMIHPPFLHHYIVAQRDTIFKLGTGSTFPNITTPVLAGLSIPIAPLNEQRRIVTKIEELFSDLDAGFAALQRAKANLKRYRAAVLKAAVEGKLTEDWRAKNPARESGSVLLARILKERRQKWEAGQLGKFEAAGKRPPKGWQNKYVEPKQPVSAGLPELPKSWCWASVEQITAEESYSLAIGPFGSNLIVSDYRDKGVPLIFVRNIRSASFGDDRAKYVSHEKASELAAHSVESGDILITKMGDPPGDACLYPAGQLKGIITADCIKLRLHQFFYSPMYFVYCINSQLVRSQVLGITKGVAQQKVSLARFSELAIPLPPLEEQKEIATLIGADMSQCDNSEAVINRNLGRAYCLRQSILKQAFEGKLVPQDPMDQPASDLLERLRHHSDVQNGNSQSTSTNHTRVHRPKTKTMENTDQ